MRRILGAAEPGFSQSEACLHEHDEKSGNQRPHHIDGDFGMSQLTSDLLEGRIAGFGGCNISGCTSGRAGRVAGKCRHR